MPTPKPLILMPETGNGLVGREAADALATLGHPVAFRTADRLTPQTLARMFALPPARSSLPAHPGLFFSINFHGLDKFGEIAALFTAHGVPVAVWCVDNPWNLLSGLRTDFWKDVHLFVTDPSFIPDLIAHGARRVKALPLATDMAVFAPETPTIPAVQDTNPLVFVGRSTFPDKERFFVGQSIPRDIRNRALAGLHEGHRADFAWWKEALAPAIGTAPLWPGSAVRKISLGAEESSLAWRICCLEAARPLGLTVYGDANWATQFALPPTLRPPLDYYTRLAAVYATAPFSLNFMSFLLPQGLNQRHFDVWAAGGFCLMDTCQGLSLFPRELTEPVAFAKPGDIPDMVAFFTAHPADKAHLAAAWRTHILEGHTYIRRLQTITDLFR